MYDELVKSLRICADGEHCDQCAKWDIKQNGGRNACEYAICTEAADAIESTSKAYQMMADAYEAEVTTPRWISVEERLPENGQYVLAYSADDDFTTVEARHRFAAFQITHWMPLPEPPKEEN